MKQKKKWLLSFLPLSITLITNCDTLQENLAHLTIQLEFLHQQLPPPQPTWTFTIPSLKEKLDKVPKNERENIYEKIVPAEELLQAVDTCAQKIKETHEKNQWVDNYKIPPEIYKLEKYALYPYAQKLVVPRGSGIACWGDIHGSAFSLLEDLGELITLNKIDEKFKIVDEKFYMVFLGDYVDRGYFGTEVLYMLLRLKIENPDKVILLRGNHEDKNLNFSGGFEAEFKLKYKKAPTSVYNLYTLLPIVLYCGSQENEKTNYIQCCHGGIEFGYLPHKLFNAQSTTAFQRIQRLNRKTNFDALLKKMEEGVLAQGNKIETFAEYLQAISKSSEAYEARENQDFDIEPENNIYLGFNWSDFTKGTNYLILNKQRKTGLIYGEIITKNILQFCSTDNHILRSIFRAHQHNSSMQGLLNSTGLYNLWNGTVYTFLSAPYAELGFNYSSFGLLTIKSDYRSWSILHIYKKMKPQEEANFQYDTHLVFST